MAGLWLIIGGLNGLIAVAAGAYGWHSLGADDSIREIFMMGVSYQMWHALAILAVAFAAARPDLDNSRLPTIAGLCFLVGIFLFSGTLYAYSLLGEILLDGAAPFGGFLLMAGWAALMMIGWKIVMAMDPPRP